MTKVNQDSTVSLQLREGTKAKLFLITYKNNSYWPANTSGTLHRANMMRLAQKKRVKSTVPVMRKAKLL